MRTSILFLNLLLNMLLTLVTEDEFGKAVATILGRKLSVEEISLKQALACDWNKTECGLVAVCTDRPYYTPFEELDRKIRKANRPLTFACIKDSTLIIGPLIVPGKSACYRCFHKRMLCHMGATMKVERVVRTALDRDWSLRSPGWLPTTPAMAAARLANQVLLREPDIGRVLMVSLVGPHGHQIQDFRVQKVHGCDCIPSHCHGNEQSNNLIAVVGEYLS